jgi:hypothetical protein
MQGVGQVADGVDSHEMSRRLLIGVFALVALAAAVTVEAQFGRRYGIRMATPDSFDGRFNFCRIAFRAGFNGDGGGWSVDYPQADINFSTRLGELTLTRISKTTTGSPNHLVLRLTDKELFECPFIMMTEVGTATFNKEEATALRTYLLKGGFLWADDFWGSYAWTYWVSQIQQVLPPTEYPIIDLALDHPLFRTQFEIREMPQISSIGFWRGTGGTSERGRDSAIPHARAITDKHGNVIVLMTHNTDIGDSWEREAEDPEYFYNFSVPGYSLGINALLYALTH